MARWAIFDLLNMFFCSTFRALSNRKKNIFVSIEMTTLCNSTFFPKTFASFIIFRLYNEIDVLKLPFLEELYEKTFVVPYVK